MKQEFSEEDIKREHPDWDEDDVYCAYNLCKKHKEVHPANLFRFKDISAFFEWIGHNPFIAKRALKDKRANVYRIQDVKATRPDLIFDYCWNPYSGLKSIILFQHP